MRSQALDTEKKVCRTRARSPDALADPRNARRHRESAHMHRVGANSLDKQAGGARLQPAFINIIGFTTNPAAAVESTATGQEFLLICSLSHYQQGLRTLQRFAAAANNMHKLSTAGKSSMHTGTLTHQLLCTDAVE